MITRFVTEHCQVGMFQRRDAIDAFCVTVMSDLFTNYSCVIIVYKPRLRNDLLCVEWDVKPYTLTIVYKEHTDAVTLT